MNTYPFLFLLLKGPLLVLRTKISYGTEHAFEFSGGIDRKFLQ